MVREDKNTRKSTEKRRRSRLPQKDIPRYPIDEALRVPKAIMENYAGEPTQTLHVAAAMNMQPNSGTFRNLCGAAAAYGFTKGTAYAQEIKIEPLAERIIRPLSEGEELKARREAILNLRIVKEFLQKYDGSPLPREDIARNVLTDMGVPIDRAQDALDMVVSSAESVGFIRTIKDKKYVDLPGSSSIQEARDEKEQHLDPGSENPRSRRVNGDDPTNELLPSPHIPQSQSVPARNRRVFITHGKNQAFVAPMKKLLRFGELEPVVSVESQSVSQPVPDKVMNDMRSCGAAIIHVDAERKLIDENANEHIVLNPNVLIEIGAAMALYGRRFILLVKRDVTLPSNLQGVYEVRYSGDTLDGDATIRLLEAINDIKNHQLPDYLSSIENQG